MQATLSLAVLCTFLALATSGPVVNRKDQGYEKDIFESMLKEVISDEITKLKKSNSATRSLKDPSARDLDRLSLERLTADKLSMGNSRFGSEDKVIREMLNEATGRRKPSTDDFLYLEKKFREQKLMEEQAKEEKMELEKMRHKIEQEALKQERMREERQREERFRDEQLHLEKMKLENLRHQLVEERFREERLREEKERLREEEMKREREEEMKREREEQMKRDREEQEKKDDERRKRKQREEDELKEAFGNMGSSTEIIEDTSYGSPPSPMMAPPSPSPYTSRPMMSSPFGPSLSSMSSMSSMSQMSPMSSMSHFGPPMAPIPHPGMSPYGSGSPMMSSMSSYGPKFSSSMYSPMSMPPPRLMSPYGRGMGAYPPPPPSMSSMYSPSFGLNARSGSSGEDASSSLTHTKDKTGKKIKNMLMDFAVSSILDIGMVNLMGNILGKTGSTH
ncbi:Reticulocyte-binding protein 2 -like protein a [Halotydeus destructor]|nr:Reticulocyte-binding protein 2 -like protein a [Halotydeus destructor]